MEELQHAVDDLAGRLRRSVVIDDETIRLLLASRHSAMRTRCAPVEFSSWSQVATVLAWALETALVGLAKALVPVPRSRVRMNRVHQCSLPSTGVLPGGTA
jgi:hypothetical protein